MKRCKNIPLFCIFLDNMKYLQFRKTKQIKLFIGIKKMCEFQGIKQLDGSQWEFECNTCLCNDGKVICLRVS